MAREREDAYAAAFREWEAGEDARLWDTTIADGIGDGASDVCLVDPQPVRGS